MGLGYVVTGILYRGLCPDALNDPNVLCLYHFARYMRIYRTITLPSQFNDFCVSKIYMKSVSRDNVFGSSILRFSMFSFSAAESSKFISFNLDLYNSLF